MKLIDHEKYPIVMIVCVPNSNQFVSVDEKGIAKIWDI